MAVRCMILASAEDKKYQGELEDQLAVYVQQGILTLSGLGGAPAGADERQWRARALGQAEVILLLVSPRLERSEPDLLSAALDRRESGARVIPILLKPFDFSASRYRDLVALPRNGVPVSAHSRRDKAWLEIAKELRELLSEPTKQNAKGATGVKPLLSWLHLSDLHFGHGTSGHRYNQQRMLATLAEDVKKQVSDGILTQPDLILITGDIAFSGGDLNRAPVEDEYTHAATWLAALAASLNVPDDHIVLVPGNHDVQRSADSDPATKKLVEDLRSGTRSIDDAFQDLADRPRLLTRQAKYRAFASRYARPLSAGSPWATYSFAVRDVAVRLLGLNTALLAADDHDLGRLRIGERMLTELLFGLSPAAESIQLVLSLSHHPLFGGWLADEPNARKWLRRHVHCHLAGHVHEAESESARSGSGAEWLCITAGAAHAEAMPQGMPAGHGYNIAAVCDTPAGVKLRIWPRKFSDPNADFRPDIDKVNPQTLYAEHDVRLRRPPGKA